MSSRRPMLLMAVLLLLVGMFAGRAIWQRPDLQSAARPPEPLLPGESSISNVIVSQRADAQWQVSIDYFSRGEPAWIEADIGGVANPEGPRRGVAMLFELKRGANHGALTLMHPGIATRSRQVIVRMIGRDPPRPILASAQVEHLIDWPSVYDYQEAQEFARHSPEQNLGRAVGLIDEGNRQALGQAKIILERLIQADARFERAYIELARVAMKTNWGPEGLHHAEGLLSSALQIQPDSVNAKILLGYVYTHQGRYQLAEKLFAESAVSNPPNIWLWANWGEMLALQEKYAPAIAKYREAIARPTTLETYERARFDAYTKLLALLERKKDLDGMEALYQKAVETFGYSGCHALQYGRFLLQQRGNADAAIEVTRKALDVNCRDQDARELLGLAYYVAWSKSEGTARLEALNQARIYLPPGARAIYLLARSETTAKAAAQLVSSGENIDNKDNEQLNALGLAVQSEDVPTARRLLRLGASPAAPVGYGGIPVALMPVMSGNLELIKLMRQFGADYAKLTYEGATAFDFAKQSGDADLLRAIESTPRTL